MAKTEVGYHYIHRYCGGNSYDINDKWLSDAISTRQLQVSDIEGYVYYPASLSSLSLTRLESSTRWMHLAGVVTALPSVLRPLKRRIRLAYPLQRLQDSSALMASTWEWSSAPWTMSMESVSHCLCQMYVPKSSQGLRMRPPVRKPLPVLSAGLFRARRSASTAMRDPRGMAVLFGNRPQD